MQIVTNGREKNKEKVTKKKKKGIRYFSIEQPSTRRVCCSPGFEFTDAPMNSDRNAAGTGDMRSFSNSRCYQYSPLHIGVCFPYMTFFNLFLTFSSHFLQATPNSEGLMLFLSNIFLSLYFTVPQFLSAFAHFSLMHIYVTLYKTMFLTPSRYSQHRVVHVYACICIQIYV